MDDPTAPLAAQHVFSWLGDLTDVLLEELGAAAAENVLDSSRPNNRKQSSILGKTKPVAHFSWGHVASNTGSALKIRRLHSDLPPDLLERLPRHSSQTDADKPSTAAAAVYSLQRNAPAAVFGSGKTAASRTLQPDHRPALEPKIDAVKKRAPGVSMGPASADKKHPCPAGREHALSESEEEEDFTIYEPRYEKIERSAPAIGFPTAPRWPKPAWPEKDEDKEDSSTNAGKKSKTAVMDPLSAKDKILRRKSAAVFSTTPRFAGVKDALRQHTRKPPDVDKTGLYDSLAADGCGGNIKRRHQQSYGVENGERCIHRRAPIVSFAHPSVKEEMAKLRKQRQKHLAESAHAKASNQRTQEQKRCGNLAGLGHMDGIGQQPSTQKPHYTFCSKDHGRSKYTNGVSLSTGVGSAGSETGSETPALCMMEFDAAAPAHHEGTNVRTFMAVTGVVNPPSHASNVGRQSDYWVGKDGSAAPTANVKGSFPESIQSTTTSTDRSMNMRESFPESTQSTISSTNLSMNQWVHLQTHNRHHCHQPSRQQMSSAHAEASKASMNLDSIASASPEQTPQLRRSQAVQHQPAAADAMASAASLGPQPHNTLDSLTCSAGIAQIPSSEMAVMGLQTSMETCAEPNSIVGQRLLREHAGACTGASSNRPAPRNERTSDLTGLSTDGQIALPILTAAAADTALRPDPAARLPYVPSVVLANMQHGSSSAMSIASIATPVPTTNISTHSRAAATDSSQLHKVALHVPSCPPNSEAHCQAQGPTFHVQDPSQSGTPSSRHGVSSMPSSVTEYTQASGDLPINMSQDDGTNTCSTRRNILASSAGPQITSALETRDDMKPVGGLQSAGTQSIRGENGENLTHDMPGADFLDTSPPRKWADSEPHQEQGNASSTTSTSTSKPAQSNQLPAHTQPMQQLPGHRVQGPHEPNMQYRLRSDAHNVVSPDLKTNDLIHPYKAATSGKVTPPQSAREFSPVTGRGAQQQGGHSHQTWMNAYKMMRDTSAKLGPGAYDARDMALSYFKKAPAASFGTSPRDPGSKPSPSRIPRAHSPLHNLDLTKATNRVKPRVPAAFISPPPSRPPTHSLQPTNPSPPRGLPSPIKTQSPLRHPAQPAPVSIYIQSFSSRISTDTHLGPSQPKTALTASPDEEKECDGITQAWGPNPEPHDNPGTMLACQTADKASGLQTAQVDDAASRKCVSQARHGGGVEGQVLDGYCVDAASLAPRIKGTPVFKLPLAPRISRKSLLDSRAMSPGRARSPAFMAPVLYPSSHSPVRRGKQQQIQDETQPPSQADDHQQDKLTTETQEATQHQPATSPEVDTKASPATSPTKHHPSRSPARQSSIQLGKLESDPWRLDSPTRARKPAWSFLPVSSSSARLPTVPKPRSDLNIDWSKIKPRTGDVGIPMFSLTVQKAQIRTATLPAGSQLAVRHVPRWPAVGEYNVEQAWKHLRRRVPGAILDLVAARWKQPVQDVLQEAEEEGVLDLAAALRWVRPSPPTWSFAPAVPGSVPERFLHAQPGTSSLQPLNIQLTLVRKRLPGVVSFELQVGREREKADAADCAALAPGWYNPDYQWVEPAGRAVGITPARIVEIDDEGEPTDVDGDVLSLDLEQADKAVRRQPAVLVTYSNMLGRQDQPEALADAPPGYHTRHLPLPDPDLDVPLLSHQPAINLVSGTGHRPLFDEPDPKATVRGPGTYDVHLHKAFGMEDAGTDFARAVGRGVGRDGDEGRLVEGDRLLLDPNHDILRPSPPRPLILPPPSHPSNPTPPNDALQKFYNYDLAVTRPTPPRPPDFTTMAERQPLHAISNNTPGGETRLWNVEDLPLHVLAGYPGVRSVPQFDRMLPREQREGPETEGFKLDLQPEKADALVRPALPCPVNMQTQQPHVAPADLNPKDKCLASLMPWIYYEPRDTLTKPSAPPVPTFTTTTSTALRSEIDALPGFDAALDGGIYYPKYTQVHKSTPTADFQSLSARKSVNDRDRAEGNTLVLHPTPVGEHYKPWQVDNWRPPFSKSGGPRFSYRVDTKPGEGDVLKLHVSADDMGSPLKPTAGSAPVAAFGGMGEKRVVTFKPVFDV